MDPLAAREFRSLIGELRDEGRTILLATHDMVEAEMVCDRVTLIDRGKVIATESPRMLGQVLERLVGAGRHCGAYEPAQPRSTVFVVSGTGRDPLHASRGRRDGSFDYGA